MNRVASSARSESRDSPRDVRLSSVATYVPFDADRKNHAAQVRKGASPSAPTPGGEHEGVAPELASFTTTDSRPAPPPPPHPPPPPPPPPSLTFNGINLNPPVGALRPLAAINSPW
ncbi:hypothetical protein EYF80_038118 [Liparis tanakae]|uniref:Uncharacterized protein n=1 Tax=Liparis tanakae TaxID=230148 RepID=A0A4Z2GDP5_9TELE|nr:hypothetical protein EYF80_038118 [Liparis tanakae]